MEKNENISDHYSTLKKISRDKKDFQLIPTRHSNLFPAASMSVKKVKIRVFATYIQSIFRVKHGAVDVDPNPRKQHRYVSKKASKKNHQCQVAKDDLQ